jgi:D-alanyl-D-alanine endopeptidase (penicillin-binding protein 7)
MLKFNRIFLIIITALVVTNAYGAKKKSKAPPAEPARAVLLFDRKTNTVQEAQEIHTAMPIASLTKLMTVLVVLESHTNLDEHLPVVPQKIEGSRVLRTGMSITRRELINLSLIASDNLASKLLAVHHPLGYDTFIRQMNATADRLNMKNTLYVDPSGLLTNTSTAWDLHLLNNELLKHPVFAASAMSKTYNSDAQDRRGRISQFIIRNTSKFAGEYNIKVGKTGFTTPAGWCISMVINYNATSFDLIVLGSPNKQTRNDLVSKRLSNYLNYITRYAVENQINGHYSE